MEYLTFGQVGKTKHTIEEIKKNKYPTSWGELYLQMISQMADKRPTIKQAKQELEKMIGIRGK